MNKFFQSSINPDQLSLTVKGVFAFVVPIAGLVVNHFGHSLDNTQVKALEDTLTELIVVGSTFISLVMVIVGLARKLFVSLKNS